MLYQRKCMLCMEGSIWYYSFWVFKSHPNSQCRLTLTTAATYACQSSKKTLCTGQPENEMLYSARITQEKYWISAVLYHLPYSPEREPSDLYLFRSLKNALNYQKNYEDQAKTFVEDLRTLKNSFFFRGINNLPDKWKRWFKIIANILLIENNSVLN